MNWQPIETIPDSPDLVLVCRPDMPMTIVRADDWHTGFAHWLESATHWMPLPEPPKAERAAGKDWQAEAMRHAQAALYWRERCEMLEDSVRKAQQPAAAVVSAERAAYLTSLCEIDCSPAKPGLNDERVWTATHHCGEGDFTGEGATVLEAVLKAMALKKRPQS